MNRGCCNTQHDETQAPRLRPVGHLLMAGLVLTICSCHMLAPPADRVTPNHPAMLPPDAWTGVPSDGAAAWAASPYCPTATIAFVPPACGQLQWRPPGIPGPWPMDEHLCDGGDQPPSAEVLQDWSIVGLDQEDTVAHYDTVSGETHVEAANRVCLYAPRFASVRQVRGALAHEVHDRVAGMEAPQEPQLREERRLVSTVNQPVQAERYLGTDSPQQFMERTRGGGVAGLQTVGNASGRFKSHEDFQIIRNGIFDNSEKARLAVRLDAAHAWASHQAVQVTLDGKAAVVAANSSASQSVYRYDMPAGKPRLRIVKVASTASAHPGDEVEFTLRFDNVGDQTIGNVTVVDSLTTRLQYVPDSAQCSLAAKFLTQENEGESLVLRWEIADPLKVGQGGIIRFKCRVR